MNLYPPGTDNLPAGEYLEVYSSGATYQPAKYVTIEKGDRLPPTRQAGNMWKRVY